MITAIFATKDSEMPLAYALHALVPAAMVGIVREVIVVDGGSRDGTRVVADAAGCEIIEGSGVVEEDLRRTANRARADWLLFMSPAAVLDADWHNEALEFIDRATEAGSARSCAAVFRLGHSGDSFRDRMAEWMATFRTKTLAAPYLEQGLLISRALYREVGGHRQLPAMAEVDLARRIGRRRLTLLRKRANVRTPVGDSGSVARAIRSGLCLALFVLRLPPALIGRLAAG
jgi:glycosyltransferase involved in cell wall biosynthesis